MSFELSLTLPWKEDEEAEEERRALLKRAKAAEIERDVAMSERDAAIHGMRQAEASRSTAEKRAGEAEVATAAAAQLVEEVSAQVRELRGLRGVDATSVTVRKYR